MVTELVKKKKQLRIIKSKKSSNVKTHLIFYAPVKVWGDEIEHKELAGGKNKLPKMGGEIRSHDSPRDALNDFGDPLILQFVGG